MGEHDIHYTVRDNWAPCTKVKYTELGAKMALAKIEAQRKRYKQHRKRKERSAYYCKECLAYHLSSYKPQ